MLTPSRIVLLLAALGWATACDTMSRQPLKVTIRESTIPYDSTVGPTNFDVTVMARNDGKVPVYFSSRCQWDAQRLIGREWTTLKAPDCPSFPYDKLDPGDSAVFGMTISDPTTGARDATPESRRPRMYRLRFGIGIGKEPDYLGDPSSFATAISSPVVVK